MNGDLTKQLSDNVALTAGLIKSLDGIVGLAQGGFTIGTTEATTSITPWQKVT